MFLFVLAGFVPLGVLGWFAWIQLAKEESQVLADSRQKGEAALAAVEQRYHNHLRELITRETQRDFTEYQHWHAPLNIQAAAPSVVRSPLAGQPEDRFVRYYFQLTSDGNTVNYSSPHDSEAADLPLEQYQTLNAQSPDFLTANSIARPEIMGELNLLAARAPVTVDVADVPPQHRGLSPAKQGQAAVNNDGQREAREEPARAPSDGLRLALVRSGLRPVSEQSLINEVLLVNFNSREVAMNAQRQQIDRVGKKAYNNDYNWGNLNRGPDNLDPLERSLVKVYPYCLYVGGSAARPLVLLWRSVVTPTHTLVQGMTLDLGYLSSTWLPQQLDNSGDLRLTGAITLNAASQGTVLNPEARDFENQTRSAFSALPLAVVTETGPVKARFETTRSHYILVACGYLFVLGLLGFLLVRTIARHAALLRQQQDFLAAVSHELRTPLSSMRLYTELALQNTGGNETLTRHVDRILKEEDRLTRIIEMLLLSAKIERGALTLEPADIPLHEPLREAVALARTYHPQREITLVDNTLPAARLDRAAASQLFYNLIDNGLKYSRETGRPVDVAVQTTPEKVTVLVRDYGCGISKADLGKLFQRFYRGAGASSYGAGTGLGLWLCKTYADAMGWKLEVNSHPGEGTCISVHIPLA
ncbi:MAG: HAMP domain-containing histidine kinase [Planctomycetes bacterium]|nr:HAMP domain-containing histidine kinase [Planctomycetota bacterium]